MINAKMWLVVKPTVGLPLFFIGVVVASLSIHLALLLNTAYFPAFLRGGDRPARSSEMVVPPGTGQVALPADAVRAGVVLAGVAPAR